MERRRAASAHQPAARPNRPVAPSTNVRSAPSLAQRLAEAEATIAALVSRQVDAVLDPETQTPRLLSAAQEALRTSEARYHALFNNMLEGYAYCQTLFEENELRDFIYLEVNSAFERLTGLKDVVG